MTVTAVVIKCPQWDVEGTESCPSAQAPLRNLCLQSTMRLGTLSRWQLDLTEK